MALGLASAVANDFLDWIGNASATSAAPTNVFIKLHIGDPGSVGTANVAGNDTREQVSFGTPTGGVIANDVAITWIASEVDTAEDYTHWSLWDNLTAGNFLFSGVMTAAAVAVGNEFTIPIGSFTLTFTIAA